MCLSFQGTTAECSMICYAAMIARAQRPGIFANQLKIDPMYIQNRAIDRNESPSDVFLQPGVDNITFANLLKVTLHRF